MIACQKDRSFYFQQFRFVNDDLSTIDPDSNTGYNFKNAIQQTLIFVNITEIPDDWRSKPRFADGGRKERTIRALHLRKKCKFKVDASGFLSRKNISLPPRIN